MRTRTHDDHEQSEQESMPEPKPASAEDRLAALEAYVAFIRPKLVPLIGEEPPPPAEE